MISGNLQIKIGTENNIRNATIVCHNPYLPMITSYIFHIYVQARTVRRIATNRHAFILFNSFRHTPKILIISSIQDKFSSLLSE